MSVQLVEGRDYYLEDGLMVLTAYFLKNRGYCCGNDCRNCPYKEGRVVVCRMREGDD